MCENRKHDGKNISFEQLIYHLRDVFHLSYSFSIAMAQHAFTLCNRIAEAGVKISLREVDLHMGHHQANGQSILPFLEEQTNAEDCVKYSDILRAIDNRDQTRRTAREEERMPLTPHMCEHAEWILMMNALALEDEVMSRFEVIPLRRERVMGFLEDGRLPEGRMKSRDGYELEEVISEARRRRNRHLSQKEWGRIGVEDKRVAVERRVHYEKRREHARGEAECAEYDSLTG